MTEILFEPIPLPVEPSQLGESPFWHPEDRALYWVDIPSRTLQRYSPTHGMFGKWTFSAEIASCAPLLGGDLLLAARDGIWRFDPGTGRRRRIAHPPYDAAIERFNDGKADPQGRFWVTTIYEPRDQAAASLHCWSGGRLLRAAGGITVGNGLGWSLDGQTMYLTDTKAHRIDAMRMNALDGSLSGRQPWVQFPLKDPEKPLSEYGGRPDGAAIDSEGCYWVAMFEGQRLLRLSPAGEILREVKLPVQCPTMPCFGDADLRTLYVTTARDKRPAEELQSQPWAGCVLHMRVDVPGLPVQFAAG